MCETSGEGGIRQRTGFYARRGIHRRGRHDAEGLEGADSLSRLESAQTWLSWTERIFRLGPSFRRNESVCALFFGTRQNGEPLEGGTSVVGGLCRFRWIGWLVSFSNMHICLCGY